MLIDYLFYLFYRAYRRLFKDSKLIADSQATALVGVVMVFYAWWIILLATAGVIELSGGNSKGIFEAVAIPTIFLSPLPMLYAYIRYQRKNRYVRILKKFEQTRLGKRPLVGAFLFVGISIAGLVRIAMVLRAWIAAGY